MKSDHRQEPDTPGRLGLGTGTLASLGRSASLAEVGRLLDAMESHGLRIIDTADSYGSGDCERLLGRALRGRKHGFQVITKAGYRHANLPGPLRHFNQFAKKIMQKTGARQRFDAGYLESCAAESLKRLGVDHVHAFLLHDPTLEAVQLPSTAQSLQRIKQQGKATATGISSGDPAVLDAALQAGICDVVECPAHLRVAADLLGIWDHCARDGIHVIGNHVYAPDCLSLPGEDHESLMRASAALLPRDATILCGTRNPGHLLQSLQWAQNPMDRDEAVRRCESVRTVV